MIRRQIFVEIIAQEDETKSTFSCQDSGILPPSAGQASQVSQARAPEASARQEKLRFGRKSFASASSCTERYDRLGQGRIRKSVTKLESFRNASHRKQKWTESRTRLILQVRCCCLYEPGCNWSAKIVGFRLTHGPKWGCSGVMRPPPHR